MMIKIFIPVLSACLLLSTATHATQNTTERLLSISQYMIDSFALKPRNQQESFIQFSAAMTGITVAQARENFLKEKPEITEKSTRDAMREHFLSEFDQKDYPTVKPAIEQYLQLYSDFLSTCKTSQNYTQPDATSYLIPVTCSLPKVEWKNIKEPILNEKDSDAQNFAKTLMWLSKTLQNAPRQTLNTHIIVENQEGVFYANPDYPNYFPDAATRELSDESATDELNSEE